MKLVYRRTRHRVPEAPRATIDRASTSAPLRGRSRPRPTDGTTLRRGRAARRAAAAHRGRLTVAQCEPWRDRSAAIRKADVPDAVPRLAFLRRCVQPRPRYTALGRASGGEPVVGRHPVALAAARAERSSHREAPVPPRAGESRRRRMHHLGERRHRGVCAPPGAPSPARLGLRNRPKWAWPRAACSLRSFVLQPTSVPFVAFGLG